GVVEGADAAATPGPRRSIGAGANGASPRNNSASASCSDCSVPVSRIDGRCGVMVGGVAGGLGGSFRSIVASLRSDPSGRPGRARWSGGHREVVLTAQAVRQPGRVVRVALPDPVDHQTVFVPPGRDVDPPLEDT